MTLDPDDDKVRIATFGREVELFLGSDIGRYLVDCARREEEAAMNALKDCDATDIGKVVALQMKAKVADLFLAWLGEAVHAGHNAIELIDEERSHG